MTMDHETRAILLAMEDQLRLLTERVLSASDECEGKLLLMDREKRKLGVNLEELEIRLHRKAPR